MTAANAGICGATCDSGREMMRSPTATAVKPSGTLACISASIGRFGSSWVASFTTGSAGPKRGSAGDAPAGPTSEGKDAASDVVRFIV